MFKVLKPREFGRLKKAFEKVDGAKEGEIGRMARQDSAEDFSRLNALLCTATDWIFIPAYCFAIP